MMKTTTISHNSKTYDLNIGSWLKHLNSDPAEALYEIFTDDIWLPNQKTAGNYKIEKKAQYDCLTEKSGLSAKKYLSKSSLHDFGYEWDALITLIKKNINNSCIPLLFARHKRSKEEQNEILNAASNGHIGAMYWIGTALRDGQNDDCLLWLSMAHNRGHVGACYEMALHLASKENFLDSLRCLIISADGGADIAYLNLFHIDMLTNMFKIKDVSLLQATLEELSSVTHSSSARYFNGMLLLFLGKKNEGAALLRTFMRAPKNQPPKDDVDISYEKQFQIVSKFIENVLEDINSGVLPLNTILLRGKEAGFSSFTDYLELIRHLHGVLRSK